MTQASPLAIAVFAALALGAILLASFWMMRGAARAKAPPADMEAAVYRSQLAEVERDVASGRLPPESADAARLEIGRRLARLEARLAGAAEPARGSARMVALVAAILVGGGSAALYLVRGTLEPDRPFDQRKRELLERPPQSLTDEEIMAILQERARRAPQDPAPHVFMGQILAETGREAEAVRAFQAALRRDPRNVDAMAELGGLLVQGNEGRLDGQSRIIFDTALAIDPDHPMARYYLALARWQGGERDAALADWRAAWGGLPAGDPRRTTLTARVADALSALDRGPGSGGTAGEAPFAAMADMPHADRAAFIQTMISQRAARQAAAPRDLGLRLSLMRVEAMSGNRAAAERLLADGVRLAAGDAFTQQVLAAAAISVGLPLPPPSGPPRQGSGGEVAK
jgi:cytochrome c-type biogenesis protein CcmH